MIHGKVSAFLEATLVLQVYGPTGHVRDVEVIIDTGFDGALILPASIITDLSLNWQGQGRAFLADGRESIFDIYDAFVLWDGNERRIAVDKAETKPLIGMSLLQGHGLYIEAIEQGDVTIEPLPHA